MSNNTTKLYWEKLSGKYIEPFVKEDSLMKEISEKELSLIKKYLFKLSKSQQHVRILEIGFGAGRILKELLNTDVDFEYIGIDYSKSMTDFCMSNYNDSRIKKFICDDISKYDINILKNKKFDYIISVRCFKYSKNIEDILGYCCSLLAQKGIFLFSVSNKFSVRRLNFWLPTKIYYVSERKIKNILKSLNLNLINEKCFSIFPDFLYFKKSFVRDKLLWLDFKISKPLKLLCKEKFFVAQKIDKVNIYVDNNCL